MGIAAPGHAQTAAFAGIDSTTRGDWTTKYGGDGYWVSGAGSANPSYMAAGLTTTGASSYTWSGLNYDTKSLYQTPTPPNRIAALIYNTAATNGSSFTIDLPITDTATHKIALYCLDYDNGGRSETVQVKSYPSGTVLATQSISNFHDGCYLLWNVSGHVQFVVTQNGGYNAGVSGVFFDNATPPATTLGEIDVTSYGAVANGSTDNTAAFQNALNDAGRTGAIVKVPAGQYYFAGNPTTHNPSLNVPPHVVLEGVSDGERSYLGYSNGTGAGDVLADRGTVFLVGPSVNGPASYGTGVNPFITLNDNSALRAVTIYYPNQPLSTTNGWSAPTVYPDTIYMQGNTCSVDSVCGVNPYSFITKKISNYTNPNVPIDGNVRSNVRHVTGQPLKQGLLVDSDLDVTHYEDIHFGPIWDNHAAMTNWMLANSWAFTIYRGDDMKFTDCSAVNYNRGFYCDLSTSGGTGSGFEGCTAENCMYGAYIGFATADSVDNFHGCAFSSNAAVDGAAVFIGGNNNGNVIFDGCRFWQARHNLFINKSTKADPARMGSVAIMGCSFDTWGTQSTGLDPASAAIACGDFGNPTATCGKTSITDCTFGVDQYTYAYTPGVAGVLFDSNTLVNGSHVYAPNAPQPTAANPYYRIQPSYNSSLVLNVYGNNPVNGNVIDLWTDYGNAYQRWTLIPNSDGTYGVSPACAPGGGLDDYGGSTTSGTLVDLWQIIPGDTHTEWNLLPSSSVLPSTSRYTPADGLYQIQPAGATSLMLDAYGASNSAGANVDIYTQNGSAAQSWLLTAIGYIETGNN